MKISENWLRELVSTDLSREEISEKLTMLGLEVDSVGPVSNFDLSEVILGKVMALSPLQAGSKLKVCQVDIGGGALRTVVCGASEIVENMLVAYAPVGSFLGDKKVTERDFDGVSSEGILCSREDLGLEEKSEQLLEVPIGDAKEGDFLSKILGLPDYIFDLDLTPNRGDCFSVLGIARELSSLGKNRLETPRITPAVVKTDEIFDIEIKAGDCCPKYTGRVIRGVTVAVQTPAYISERLLRSGVRPINPVVDITNYVMLEMGQPMHAFDFSTLSGGINVRRANKGEVLELLDGKRIELEPEVLIISDHTKPIALAGIMGGEHSAVTHETKDLFLEAAFFEPLALAGVARRYGMQTDASTRFERGVDPELNQMAIERATALIGEICGGEASPIVISTGGDLKSKRPILFRPDAVNKRLGTNLSLSDILKNLESLFFRVEHKSEELWKVHVPSFRFDINAEVDLFEEIGRLSGYDNIPTELPILEANPRPYPKDQEIKEQIRQGFVWRSYTEVITYSFVSQERGQLLGDKELVKLTNPISAEMEVMRPNLLSSLINPLLYNINRQKDQLRLFEIGKVFRMEGNEVKEEEHIAGLLFGDLFQKQWDIRGREADFFDIKADLSMLLPAIYDVGLDFGSCDREGLHPGQSALVCSKGIEIGLIGALHPRLLEKLGISGRVLFFEVNLDLMNPEKVREFVPVSKYPSVARDISVVVNESISAKQCLSVVENLDIEILKDLQLFDLYNGQGIDSEKKSYSINLIFQSSWSTLKDNDVDSAVNIILQTLEKEVGAVLRN